MTSKTKNDCNNMVKLIKKIGFQRYSRILVHTIFFLSKKGENEKCLAFFFPIKNHIKNY